jgi:hypothetical protein
LKSFSVTLPFPLTASTVTPYQLSIALKNAARISGAAARCRSRLPDVRQLPGESN